MNIQELKTKIASSSIASPRKEKILSLLEGNVTIDTIEQVKDLVQEDTDEAMVGVLSADDQKEIDESQVKLNNDLKKVEDGLSADMDIVEAEMNDINESVKKINQVMDDSKIDAVKSKLSI